MTEPYKPTKDIVAESGAIFRYRTYIDGKVQVWILNAKEELLAGFPLTLAEIEQVYEDTASVTICNFCGERRHTIDDCPAAASERRFIAEHATDPDVTDPHIGYCWTCNEYRVKSQCRYWEVPSGNHYTCNTCLRPVDESVPLR